MTQDAAYNTEYFKKEIPTEQMMYFLITQQLSYKAEFFIFFTALLAI